MLNYNLSFVSNVIHLLYATKLTISRVLLMNSFGIALTTILPILFLYLNTVTVTAGTFEP